METRETKLRMHRGLAWAGLASGVVAILDTVAMWLVLRTWISPSEYGTASLAVTLFPVLDLATDMGLSSALVQRDDHTEEKISTVFWMNLGMSVLLAGLLFPAGHLLSAFHQQPVLQWMLFSYGGKLVFQNAYFIPHAMMRRELRFKELSMIRVVANFAEFLGKIGFAWAGFGVWMFVLAPLCRVFVTAIGIQLRHPWRPRLVMNLREARGYLKFGLTTSASQILFFCYTSIDYQVVGKFFGTTALGYYRWAYELVLEPVRMISSVVATISFSVFSRLRHRRDELVEQFIQSTRQNLVAALPFLCVILLGASEVLTVLLGPTWAEAASAARILVAVGMLRALSFVMPPLLDAMGFPSLTLVYTMIAATVLPLMFVVFAAAFGGEMGYLSVSLAWATGYPVAFAVLLFLVLTKLELSGLTFLRRISGIVVCAGAAIMVGMAARVLTASASELVRLLAVIAATLGTLFVLLAYLQGISPRAVVKALRGR